MSAGREREDESAAGSEMKVRPANRADEMREKIKSRLG